MVNLWNFPFVIYAVFVQIPCVILISHQSKLCEPRDMFCEPNEKCFMKYYLVNSTNCRDLSFNQISTTSETLGKIVVETYYYTLSTHRQTGFNVSFTDIRWKHLKFRFQQDGNELKNTCREFFIHENTTMGDMFYDCIWSLQTYEGKSFFFEYEASNSTQSVYEKFAFRVPVARNINSLSTSPADWELFIYVNIMTNTFGLTTFIVNWQEMPAKFLVDTYNVSVYINDTGSVEYVVSTIVKCSTHQTDTCQFYYNKWYGSVIFTVQPVCGNIAGGCLTTRTQVFLLGGESTKPMLICIVSVTIMVPVLLYLLFLLRNYIIYKSRLWMQTVPKVLIVYSPSIASHVDVVFALAKYLKAHCNVEPMVDEWDIPLTESKDPFKWCNESFKAAEIVMVVASPYHKHLRLANSVYHNVDVLLLRLLCERLTTRGSKTQFLSLMLPYTTEADIPAEAMNLRRFSLPHDLDRLLVFMHREWRLPECLRLPIKGGKEDLALCGKEVICSIEQAEADVKKNGGEYRRMAKEARGEEEQVSSDGELRDTRTCLEHRKEDCKEFNSHGMRNKSSLMELAKVTFSEFPGPLDNLALSGDEETESLVSSDKLSLANSHPLNLDTLNL